MKTSLAVRVIATVTLSVLRHLLVGLNNCNICWKRWTCLHNTSDKRYFWKLCSKHHEYTLMYKIQNSLKRRLRYIRRLDPLASVSRHISLCKQCSGRKVAFQIDPGFSWAEIPSVLSNLTNDTFLSSLLLHSFNSSPSFQVDEKQCKVDDVCWHADHAEVPQNNGENRREIERSGHWHPGGEEQKRCSFSGKRQSCKKRGKFESIKEICKNDIRNAEFSRNADTCIASGSYFDCSLIFKNNGRLTQAHLQSVKYDAKHTVGLVQGAIFGNEVLDQAKTTSPSAINEDTSLHYNTILPTWAFLKCGISSYCVTAALRYLEITRGSGENLQISWFFFPKLKLQPDMSQLSLEYSA